MALRHHQALAVDLSLVALTAFAAVLVRDNFVFYPPHVEAITAYALIAFATSALIFLIVGPHKPLWKCTALPDVARLTGTATVALLLAVFISFTASRLEGVARSVPFIQWFLLVGALVGVRVGARVWHEHGRHQRIPVEGTGQHLLIVGVNELTELYLQTLAAYGSSRVKVVGMLSDRRELHGREMWRQPILATPEDLPMVMADLEVHGIEVRRIAVMQPFEKLSPGAAKALLAVEQGSNVKVEWIMERLGLTEENADRSPPETLTPSPHLRLEQLASEHVEDLFRGKYGYVKRGFDIVAALLITVILAPILLAVALLVIFDVGLPIIFWQQRPGRFGRPFKLFKFCTMRAAHDGMGNRVHDELRLSMIGHLMRRTRLDELPQLYNVLLGEMSFVGPRPLLPVDQPMEMHTRLMLRPGLTGLAQVYGGRSISAEDKNVLDIWYVRNASLWLDIKILLRTLAVLVWGERTDQHGSPHLRAESVSNRGSPFESKLVDEDEQIEGVSSAG